MTRYFEVVFHFDQVGDVTTILTVPDGKELNLKVGDKKRSSVSMMGGSAQEVDIEVLRITEVDARRVLSDLN